MNELRACFIAIPLFLSTLGLKAGEGSLWQLRATDIHAAYAPAPIANGVIGILPLKEPFAIEHIMLNHVFDVPRPHTVSKVMRGINPLDVSVRIDGQKVDTTCVSGWSQTVDMKKAVHRSEFLVDGKADMEYDIYALRNLPYCGMSCMKVTARKRIQLEVRQAMRMPLDYAEADRRYREMEADGHRLYMQEAVATSAGGYRTVASCASFLFEDGRKPEIHFDRVNLQLYFTLDLEAGETFEVSLVGSVCSNRDFADPYNEAERQVVYAVHEGTDALIRNHERLWDELWESDIVIEGDDEAQRTVRFALFNLYGSCRAGSRLSISPMGLSTPGYNGHIFWDTEIWMYPPMLLLRPELAKSMLDYRVDRLPAARRKAMAYGYRGAMFPWESDDSGEEATPTFALTGPFEHHITADIGIAGWNYYLLTRDKEWLRNEGYPLLREIADFWVSRSVGNADGTYSICGVTGADEYANGVTDNAFTNASAAQALRYACRAAAVCGKTPPSVWSEVAENLRILTFADGITREHATYAGEMIKQADVNLLAYPLGVITDVERQKRDLEYYAERIDQKDGPAMSYSVFAVQYARMGNGRKAYEMFRRGYMPNYRPPFGVLSETPASQNPYFMTGAGGLLQAVLNGFGGLQLTEEGVIQVSSVLPPHWKRLTIIGVGPEKKTFVRE